MLHGSEELGVAAAFLSCCSGRVATQGSSPAPLRRSTLDPHLGPLMLSPSVDHGPDSRRVLTEGPIIECGQSVRPTCRLFNARISRPITAPALRIAVVLKEAPRHRRTGKIVGHLPLMHMLCAPCNISTPHAFSPLLSWHRRARARGPGVEGRRYKRSASWRAASLWCSRSQRVARQFN